MRSNDAYTAINTTVYYKPAVQCIVGVRQCVLGRASMHMRGAAMVALGLSFSTGYALRSSVQGLFTRVRWLRGVQ